uniref:F-box associated domain-containing protein n=1 Tax=Oryza glumipatula TaxID=40148 RepID=A0A0E0AGZ3_9ORYZ
MAPPTRQPRSGGRRKRRMAAAGDGGGGVAALMPEDMMREVLLRLPAKAAARFRAVCRPRGSGGHVDLVGLAGDVVRRTRAEEGVLELSTCGDLACVVGTDRRARVLHPVTGAGADDPLPHDLAEENKPWAGWRLEERFHAFTHAFGRASSTGEYKVLRVASLSPDLRVEQLVEVLALDRAGRAHAGARWRGMPRPPFHLAGASNAGMAVVAGVVHFLAVDIPLPFLPFEHNDDDDIHHGAIARFDLDTEQWRPLLRGPLNIHQIQQDNDLSPPLLTLTELKGFLVTVHRDRSHQSSSMDLWFLINSEEETWIKEYKIQIHLRPRDFYAHPLLVLDERMIVFCVRPKGRVMVYDLETGKCRDLGVGDCVEVGVYKGCLLSSGSVVDNDKEQQSH